MNGLAQEALNRKEAMTTDNKLTSYQFALAAAEMAANTRATNVVMLDLRGKSPVTEFFVIATGTSQRQMRTVADEVAELGKRSGFRPFKTSGYEQAKWILVDCVHVVTHVFDPDSREFYDLELLWGDSPRIDWRKELGLPPAPADEETTEFARDLEPMSRVSSIEEEDDTVEHGDADIDEDAETGDEEEPSVVVELPDMSSGSNSVEFVETDSPSKRTQKGRAAYPTPLHDEEDEETEEENLKPVAKDSLDEDEGGDEDLPQDKVKSVAMGGVSASLSSTTVEYDEDQQTDNRAPGDLREEVPEAHEEAASNVLADKPTGGKKTISKRGDMKAPPRSAPKTTKLKAGDAGTRKAAPVKAKKTAKPVAKKAGKKVAAKKPAKVAAKSAKKAAAKPVKKVAAKKVAAKKPAKVAAKTKASAKVAKKAPAKKAAAKKAPAKKSVKKPVKKAAKKSKR